MISVWRILAQIKVEILLFFFFKKIKDYFTKLLSFWCSVNTFETDSWKPACRQAGSS
jgi:hypothetical protein